MIKRILSSLSTAILLTLSTFCIKNPFVKLPDSEGGAGSTVGYGFPFEWYGVNKSTNPVISLFYSTGFIFDIAIFFLLFFVIFSVISRKKDGLSKGGKTFVTVAFVLISLLLIIQGVLFWRETGVLLWRRMYG